MDLFDYFSRVNLTKEDLPNICKQICKDYCLGDFVSYKLIETGYEDFNVVVRTNKHKYVVKFFANNRTLNNIQHYIKIVEIVSTNSKKLKTPKIYKVGDNVLGHYMNREKDVYFFVMEYIEGKTIYELNKDVDLKTLIQITFDILKYNCTNQELKEYLNTEEAKKFKQYDMWSYENFLVEYKDKSKYLSQEDKALMQGVVVYFESMQKRYQNYEKIFKNKPVMPPYMSAHNDFISTNIIIDKNGTPNYIDFSVSSVALNFVDIAIFGCDSVLSKNISAKKYVDYLKIISYILYRCHIMEYNLYPSAVSVQHAIHVLIANYYKVCEGVKSKENNYFLNLGRKGLKYIMEQKMLNAPVFNWVCKNGWFQRAELSDKSEYIKVKELIKKLGLEEIVENSIEEYHKLYNANNTSLAYKNITMNTDFDNGYHWLYANIENLNKNDSLMAISFCNENEWNSLPEEVEWTKLNVEAANRGVKIKRIFVYPDNYKHLLMENSSIKQFVKLSKKSNCEILFIAESVIKNVLHGEIKLIQPGILVFNDEIAYKDVLGNSEVRGIVVTDLAEIKKFNQIYDKLAHA